MTEVCKVGHDTDIYPSYTGKIYKNWVTTLNPFRSVLFYFRCLMYSEIVSDNIVLESFLTIKDLCSN